MFAPERVHLRSELILALFAEHAALKHLQDFDGFGVLAGCGTVIRQLEKLRNPLALVLRKPLENFFGSIELSCAHESVPEDIQECRVVLGSRERIEQSRGFSGIPRAERSFGV